MNARIRSWLELGILDFLAVAFIAAVAIVLIVSETKRSGQNTPQQLPVQSISREGLLRRPVGMSDDHPQEII